MYVITGATGNTGRRIAEALLAAGQSVTAVARHPEKLADLAAKGVHVAAGNLEDATFLASVLKGAKAAYLMIPPNFAVQHWRRWMAQMVETYAEAVRQSGVQKVVLLSSVGAHRTEGVGPIGGLGELENAFKALTGVDVLALRPGYFMENLYGSVGMIQHAGINGGVTRPDVQIALVHTQDIAEVATQRLLELNFEGFSHEFIAGPADLNFAEITAILGRGIGKPDLPYIQFSPADGKAGMLQAGLPETIADGYVEMGVGMNEGYLSEGFDLAKVTRKGTSLEWFVEHQLKHAFAQAN